MSGKVTVHLTKPPVASSSTKDHNNNNNSNAPTATASGIMNLYTTSSPNAAAAAAAALSASGAHMATPEGKLDICVDNSVGDEEEEEEVESDGLQSGEKMVEAEPLQRSAAQLKRIAWRCSGCHYNVLAMDQDGNPIPYTLSAWGQPLPMECPRCQVVHASWEPDVPFDELGQHTNIRSTLSNHTMNRPPMATRDATSEDPKESSPLVAEEVAWSLPKAQPVVSAGMGSTVLSQRTVPRPTRAPHRMCYYCSLCNRRLLRVDADGELIAMTCDAQGVPLPVECPGCHKTHSEWLIGPFSKRPAVTPEQSAQQPQPQS